MNKFVKRGLLGIATVAVPAGAVVALPMAAGAAPVPAPIQVVTNCTKATGAAAQYPQYPNGCSFVFYDGNGHQTTLTDSTFTDVVTPFGETEAFTGTGANAVPNNTGKVVIYDAANTPGNPGQTALSFVSGKTTTNSDHGDSPQWRLGSDRQFQQIGTASSLPGPVFRAGEGRGRSVPSPLTRLKPVWTPSTASDPAFRTCEPPLRTPHGPEDLLALALHTLTDFLGIENQVVVGGPRGGCSRCRAEFVARCLFVCRSDWDLRLVDVVLPSSPSWGRRAGDPGGGRDPRRARGADRAHRVRVRSGWRSCAVRVL